MNTRLNILLLAVVTLMLLLNIATTAYAIHTQHQPFTQYCDWVQPGRMLTCHR